MGLTATSRCNWGRNLDHEFYIRKDFLNQNPVSDIYVTALFATTYNKTIAEKLKNNILGG